MPCTSVAAGSSSTAQERKVSIGDSLPDAGSPRRHGSIDVARR